MQQTQFRIPVNGISLAAIGVGDPAATPVVLLHGGGQTKRSWGSTADALGSSGWYAVAVDMRGHGESDWSSDGSYVLDAFVEDVVHVVDYLGAPPILVGASLGGNASLGALGAIPHLALGLVLVDVTPYFQPAGFEPNPRVHDGCHRIWIRFSRRGRRAPSRSTCLIVQPRRVTTSCAITCVR